MSTNGSHRDRYHVIICPEYRRQVLVPPIDSRLKALVLEKQDEYGYAIVEMEVKPGHVHLLLEVEPRVGIEAVVGKIKGYTERSIRKAYAWMISGLPRLWRRSHLITSAGEGSREEVKEYIEKQKGNMVVRKGFKYRLYPNREPREVTPDPKGYPCGRDSMRSTNVCMV